MLPGRRIEEEEQNAQLAPTMPIPFEAVAPRGFPWSEIAPPLGILPRRELVNPYPDDPECAREWVEAFKFCDDLRADPKTS